MRNKLIGQRGYEKCNFRFLFQLFSKQPSTKVIANFQLRDYPADLFSHFQKSHVLMTI